MATTASSSGSLASSASSRGAGGKGVRPPLPPGPPPSAAVAKAKAKAQQHKTVSSRLPIPDGTTHLVTKSSASYVPGNLTTDGQRFAYASGRRPVIASYTHDSLARGGGVTSKGSFSSPDALVAAQLLPVSFGHVLALATADGEIHAFDATGQRLIASEVRACRDAGVASLASDGAGRLFVACERGGVRVFGVNEAALFAESTLECVARPVVAIACGVDRLRGTLACGLDDGTVLIVNSTGQGRVVAETPTSEHPITCLAFVGPNVVAGNSVGRVYVLCGMTGRKLAELSAHTRPVNAVAVHEARGLVATVSEDTWVHVWSVPAKADDISCVTSRRVESSMLTGVAFCGRGGDTVALTAYDSGTIRLFDIK